MHLPSRLRLDGWSEYESITWDIQIRDMDKAITSKKKNQIYAKNMDTEVLKVYG